MVAVTVAYAALGVVLVVTIVLVVTRNRLVRKRNRVREAFAAIDVQLTRRHIAVPRWAFAVRGERDHEMAVLERVVAAVDQLNLDSVRSLSAAETELTTAVTILERSATVNSAPNARRLFEDLLSTENRVAFARQHYNDSAVLYNAAVQAFPRNLVAKLFGIRPVGYLELRLLSE